MIFENQTIFLALIVSLLIHGLFFIFSGPTFIQHAQFSVRPSAQMVEVSIELNGPLNGPGHSVKSDQVRSNKSKSGVKVKANPDYHQNPAPEYPQLAKQMRQEGLVMLTVDADRAGDPVKVEIIQSSGYHLLDQAALEAVRHWKFQPGSIDGIPINSTVTVPIRFKLEK